MGERAYMVEYGRNILVENRWNVFEVRLAVDGTSVYQSPKFLGELISFL